MPPQPPVSVVIVVRDGERYLPDALRSVAAQSYSPAEIIVVDGQSTDNTAQIARSFPGVSYILQPDSGLAAARNLGVATANGELVAFLDHDDLWHPDKLARQVELHRADPALGYSLVQMVFFGSEEGEPRTAGTPSALLARRDLFARCGGFDPRFAIGCDAEWFTRMRDLGVPLAVVPEVLLFKRLHESNLSRNVALNRREMFQVARESISRHQRAMPDL